MWKSARIEGIATVRTVLSSTTISAAATTIASVTQRRGSACCCVVGASGLIIRLDDSGGRPAPATGYAVCPPSRTKSAPLANALSSEASHSASLATSSGWA